MVNATTKSDIFDFLIDIAPRGLIPATASSISAADMAGQGQGQGQGRRDIMSDSDKGTNEEETVAAGHLGRPPDLNEQADGDEEEDDGDEYED